MKELTSIVRLHLYCFALLVMVPHECCKAETAMYAIPPQWNLDVRGRATKRACAHLYMLCSLHRPARAVSLITQSRSNYAHTSLGDMT